METDSAGSVANGFFNPAKAVVPSFSKTFSGPVRVRSGSADVIVLPLAAYASPGRIAADGSLVYADGFEGCDVSYRCETLKTEEFITVKHAQAASQWSWELHTGGLTPRLTAMHTIELIDEKNVARLRIDAPEGSDAAGKRLRINEGLTLSLDGSRVTLAADLRGCKFPVVIDPSWSSTGAMTVARFNHLMVTLNDGTVLVIGDGQGGQTCELYNPNLTTWTAVGSTLSNRDNTSTVTLLPNSGKVLVVGGQAASTSAELYDPGTKLWTATTSAPKTFRFLHTATLFGTDQVLLAGGQSGATAEIFDTSAGGTFNFTDPMSVIRLEHAAALLDSTHVLVSGGFSGGNTKLNTSEIYDTVSTHWTTVVSPMSFTRAGHALVLLNNGKVLAVGGTASIPSADLFDPVSTTWSATGNPVDGRFSSTVTTIVGGARVLVAGGQDQFGDSNSCETYNASSGSFATTASLSQSRLDHTAVLLNDGRVLVAGGKLQQSGTVLKSCEIFDPLPTPVSQSVSVYENKSLLINLQASSFGTPTFAITTPPTHGNLSGGPQNVTYTPTPGFIGADNFTFSATDSLGMNSAVVSIAVLANTTPVLDTSGQFSLTSISENIPAASNTGTLVSDLLASGGSPYNVPSSLVFQPIVSVLQPDGKLVIAGPSNTFTFPPTSNIARLNTDGTFDTAFTNNTGEGTGFQPVNAMALQADGKIVIGGAFTTYNGGHSPIAANIVRLNPDGTLDTAFNANAGTGFAAGSGSTSVNSIAIQSDGGILVGGSFTLANGALHSNIARVNPNGSVDATYNTSVTTIFGGVTSIALQSDGKAIIGGNISNVNGTPHVVLARIKTDGTLDTTYNPVADGNGVSALAIQADDRVVVGGNSGTIKRFNTDGSTDPLFSIGSGAGFNAMYKAIAFQIDNKIVVGGSFSNFSGSGRNNIMRLNTNGSVDTSFDAQSSTNGTINTLQIQTDGKILAGGAFTTFNGLAATHLVRIKPGGTGENTRIFDPDIGAVQGIAVIALDNTNGTWQFSTNGTTFTNFAALLDTSATLLTSDTNTRVRFLPNTDFSGAVNPGITFRAWDQNIGTNGQTGVNASVNGGTTPFSTASAPAKIVVNFVNHAPTFIIGPNIATTEASVVNTFANFITGFSPGPPIESAQSVSAYIVSNDSVPVGGVNAFTAQPAITNSGTLTFTPANNIDTVTVVTVTVRVQDDGGVLNGGVDTSAPQTFTITLTPVADTLVVSNTFDTGANSLRDCMLRARNNDTITFDPDVFDLTNAQAATVINLQSALPTMIHGSVTIDASDRRVTVNGAGAGQSNGFTLASANNVIRGLSIVSFTNAGVAIQGNGATGNIIGGDRGVGAGPNGQGLRIAGSGAFGVNIDQGAANNTVKGCWVGLDASGAVSEPNLAGVVIQGGSNNNTIGSASAGEANAISGNTFEGITVTGAGTDNNIIIGNVVGVSALATQSAARELAVSRDSTDVISGRTTVQNGASGIFLSRGTKNSSIGGTATDDDATLASKSNIIGFNVGNGIEVRALTSKQNASRGNRISQNKGGGIGLFNGSNGGIVRPSFSTVETIPGRSGAFADGRAVLASIHVKGAATNGDGTPGSGVVELFSDPGDQGQIPLGRSAVSNGQFDLTVDVSDLNLSLNATYTDAVGNTSPFLVFGPPPAAGALPANLTNNLLNTLIGVDPSDSSSAATGTGTLTISKFTSVLNFTKTGHDALQATIAIKLPEGFSSSGTVVVIVCDQNSAKATLDAKGKGASGGATVKLLPAKTGGTASIQIGIKNSDLVAGFVNSGLISKTTPKTGETHTIPVAFGLATPAGQKFIYTGTVDVTYKATDKKSGKAAKK
jgi:uncharacterized delta-60 repeat protein